MVLFHNQRILLGVEAEAARFDSFFSSSDQSAIWKFGSPSLHFCPYESAPPWRLKWDFLHLKPAGVRGLRQPRPSWGCLTGPHHRWVPGHSGHKSSRSQGLWRPRVL